MVGSSLQRLGSQIFLSSQLIDLSSASPPFLLLFDIILGDNFHHLLSHIISPSAIVYKTFPNSSAPMNGEFSALDKKSFGLTTKDLSTSITAISATFPGLRSPLSRPMISAGLLLIVSINFIRDIVPVST